MHFLMMNLVNDVIKGAALEKTKLMATFCRIKTYL